MRESTLWKWIEANRPAWLAIERFEPRHPPGMADCFWTDRRSHISGWLELKQCSAGDREYKVGRIPKLGTEQPMFLRRQAENGAPSGLLLRIEDVGFLLWVSDGTREWPNMMRSTEAIGSQTVAFGLNGERVTLEEIMTYLLP